MHLRRHGNLGRRQHTSLPSPSSSRLSSPSLSSSRGINVQIEKFGVFDQDKRLTKYIQPHHGAKEASLSLNASDQPLERWDAHRHDRNNYVMREYAGESNTVAKLLDKEIFEKQEILHLTENELGRKQSLEKQSQRQLETSYLDEYSADTVSLTTELPEETQDTETLVNRSRSYQNDTFSNQIMQATNIHHINGDALIVDPEIVYDEDRAEYSYSVTDDDSFSSDSETETTLGEIEHNFLLASTCSEFFSHFLDEINDLYKEIVPELPRLLTLPGELRNKIYDYALTAPFERLAYRDISGRKMLCTPHDTTEATAYLEFNMLQYVNKQLRSETRAYHLRKNAVVFRTDFKISPSPLGTAIDFFPTALAYQVRKIVIMRTEPPIGFTSDPDFIDKYFDFPARDTLLEICRRHPQLNIHWSCPMWRLERSLCKFVILAVSVRETYRMVSITVPRMYPLVDPRLVLAIKPFFSNGRSAKDLDVQNFRIHPWNISQDLGCYVVLLSTAYTRCLLHTALGGLVSWWFDEAIRWHIQGV